ncbi:MAG: toll/interleukin-1 receptor domain-containing protein [Chloroflexota bacterium]
MKNQHSDGNPLAQAMSDATEGKRTEPRAVLRETVLADPENYRAWLWLAYTAATIEEKRASLYRALLLNPYNEKVQQEFRKTLTSERVQQAASDGAFVCYSRADELFAVEMTEQIKRRNLAVWIDMLDAPMDRDWKDSVSEALEACGVMLLVLSPNMITSEHACAELDYFLKLGKVVIPLMHHSCDTDPLNLMHPVIDFSNNYASGMRMVFALLGILNAPTG